jgi:2'-5' RNA ligase
MRTFISIEIPEEIKNNIEKLINELKLVLTPIKWVEKKNLHITLKFLGWVADDKLAPIEKCVTECAKGFKPFTLSFAGIGAFPDMKHPRVIWIGTKDGSDKAREIADCIENEASKKGFRGEEREFSPHLTIGRIKEKIDAGAVLKSVSEHENSEFGSFNVEHISIMKSTLRRTGPIYEEIKKVRLTPT